MAKRYFAKCDLDDGRVIVNKGDELFLSDARPNWLHRDGHYVCHTTSNRMEYIEVREEQQGHIHADLMLQYAQDAQETDKPWERWEVYGKITGRWIPLSECFPFLPENQYRRKPKMVYVTLPNGECVSWPEPLKEALDIDEEYWYFDASPECINYDYWKNLDFDKGLLSAGMLHLTKKAAEQHAAALHKINTQGD